jgi:hypothetical protein
VNVFLMVFVDSFVDQEGNKTAYWKESLTLSGLHCFYILLNEKQCHKSG